MLARLSDRDQLLGPLVGETETMSDRLSDAVCELVDALDTMARAGAMGRRSGWPKAEAIASANARMKVLTAIGVVKDG